MKLGFYLSPWDMNHLDYGTDAYNEYFISQLTELLTNYGDIFAVWFDGARDEDVGDWEYDWDGFYETVREYQPDAVICVTGPDVRWIGNEGGKVRESEWSVVSARSSEPDLIAEQFQQGAGDTKKLQALADDDQDKGSREKLSLYSELQWYQAEADVSIHKDWFYRPGRQRRRSVKELTKIYFNTVGGNASLLLNVPPSKNGVIEEADVQLLMDWKAGIDAVFETPLSFDLHIGNNEAAAALDLASGSYQFGEDEYILELQLACEQKVSTIVLQEEIRYSQRVERLKFTPR